MNAKKIILPVLLRVQHDARVANPVCAMQFEVRDVRPL